MRIMLALLGAILIGAFIGWLSEYLGLARKGVAMAALLGVGGAVVAFLLLNMTGIGLGGQTMTAAIGAVLALFLAPRFGPPPPRR